MWSSVKPVFDGEARPLATLWAPRQHERILELANPSGIAIHQQDRIVFAFDVREFNVIVAMWICYKKRLRLCAVFAVHGALPVLQRRDTDVTRSK